jgi:hypothetical protein
LPDPCPGCSVSGTPTCKFSSAKWEPVSLVCVECQMVWGEVL